MSNKAIYARVSTIDQDCAVQLSSLAILMQRFGWPEYRTYTEKLSGAEAKHRPELKRLMKDAKKGEIDTVMVLRMDRFGRSTLDTLSNIKLLAAYQVRFLCPDAGIDTDNQSPTGKFILTILAAVAELERGFILDRTQGGYKAYREAQASGAGAFEAFVSRRGRHSKSGKDLPVGRPKKVFHRGRIQEMRAKGISFRTIGRTLDIPESTVRLALQNCPA